jgi:hypothetical protein
MLTTMRLRSSAVLAAGLALLLLGVAPVLAQG